MQIAEVEAKQSASHELRTPTTCLCAECEVILGLLLQSDSTLDFVNGFSDRLLESSFAMTPRIVEILYQMIAFLFVISVHESAHAWTASYLGRGLLGGLIAPFRFYLMILEKF